MLHAALAPGARLAYGLIPGGRQDHALVGIELDGLHGRIVAADRLQGSCTAAALGDVPHLHLVIGAAREHRHLVLEKVWGGQRG